MPPETQKLATDRAEPSPRVSLITADRAPLPARPLFEKGEPGALVASLAHVPELLDVTLPFVSRVLGPSGIDARTKEIVILRTSVRQDCRFCTQTHTVVALDAGLTREEVVALRAPELPTNFDKRELALIRWTDAVAMGPGSVDAAVAKAMGRSFAEHEVVELTLLVATTVMLNRYCTALELPAAPARLARLEAEGLL